MRTSPQKPTVTSRNAHLCGGSAKDDKQLKNSPKWKKKLTGTFLSPASHNTKRNKPPQSSLRHSDPHPLLSALFRLFTGLQHRQETTFSILMHERGAGGCRLHSTQTHNNVRGSLVDKRVSEHKKIHETEIDKRGVWSGGGRGGLRWRERKTLVDWCHHGR